MLARNPYQIGDIRDTFSWCHEKLCGTVTTQPQSTGQSENVSSSLPFFPSEKSDSRIVQSLFITSLRYLKYSGNVPEIKLVMVSPRSG